ncbi:MAG: hypothetical protein V3U92_14580 [Cellulophaga sp.]
MNIKYVVLFFLLNSFGVFAQVNIGKSKSPLNLYVSAHKQETFDKLKNIETIFVVPNSVLDKEKLKEAIKEVWTFNKITFVEEELSDEEPKKYDPLNSIKQYILPNKMVIWLVDNVYSKQKFGGIGGPNIRTVGAYISFKFKAVIFENIKKNKKGKLKYDNVTIAEIFFTPNIRLRQDVSHSVGGKMKFGSLDKINEKYGEEPGLYNFNLGYVKNYFQELNQRLSNSQNLKIEDGIKKIKKLKELKRKTLFVPKWSLMKYKAMAATYGKTRTAEELFGKYGHKYEILSNAEINSKIMNGDDFYYLMHTQFNQKRIISIIHSTTGEIIYLDEKGSYNINDSDMKVLGKLIN